MEKITAPLKVSKLCNKSLTKLLLFCAGPGLLTIYIAKTVNSVWKIRWFVPFLLSSFRKYGLWSRRYCSKFMGEGGVPFVCRFWQKRYLFRITSPDKKWCPFHITYWELCILNCWKYSLKIVNKSLKWEILRLFQSHKILLFAFLGRFYRPKWQISPDLSSVVSHF